MSLLSIDNGEMVPGDVSLELEAQFQGAEKRRPEMHIPCDPNLVMH